MRTVSWLTTYIHPDSSGQLRSSHTKQYHCGYCKLEYTAIFLTNGLCIVYLSLPQYLPLVYLWWGQKSELFCLLVTTRRLRNGTVVGYRSTTAALYCSALQPRAFEVYQGKGQSNVPCRCLPGGHIQGHWGVFTVVPGSEGLRIVPPLPCTRQPVSFRSTYCSTL